MRRAQGSLEYLIIIAAVLSIAAIVVLFVTGSFGSASSSAQFAKCKESASACFSSHLLSPKDPCLPCGSACVDSKGNDLLEGTGFSAVEFCKAGKPDEIYPREQVVFDCEDSDEEPCVTVDGCEGTRVCSGGFWGACEKTNPACPVVAVPCGNGAIDAGEACDGTNYDGETCESLMGSGYSGSLSCSGDCLSIITTGCSSGAVPEVGPLCYDGLDNDLDGLIDREDTADCQSWQFVVGSNPSYSLFSNGTYLYAGGGERNIYVYNSTGEFVANVPLDVFSGGSSDVISISRMTDVEVNVNVRNSNNNQIGYMQFVNGGASPSVKLLTYPGGDAFSLVYGGQLENFGSYSLLASGLNSIMTYSGGMGSWIGVYVISPGESSKFLDVSKNPLFDGGAPYVVGESQGTGFLIVKYNGVDAEEIFTKVMVNSSAGFAGERIAPYNSGFVFGGKSYSGVNCVIQLYPENTTLFNVPNCEGVNALIQKSGSVLIGIRNGFVYEKMPSGAVLEHFVGNVYDFVEHNGVVYAASSTGLYKFLG